MEEERKTMRMTLRDPVDTSIDIPFSLLAKPNARAPSLFHHLPEAVICLVLKYSASGDYRAAAACSRLLWRVAWTAESCPPVLEIVSARLVPDVAARVMALRADTLVISALHRTAYPHPCVSRRSVRRAVQPGPYTFERSLVWPRWRVAHDATHRQRRPHARRLAPKSHGVERVG
jgi:hypothetical protein